MNGPERIIKPITICGGADLPHNAEGWKVFSKSKEAGIIASAAWSPDFNSNVAIGMIEREFWDPGTKLEVKIPEGNREAIIKEKFWI